MLNLRTNSESLETSASINNQGKKGFLAWLCALRHLHMIVRILIIFVTLGLGVLVLAVLEEVESFGLRQGLVYIFMGGNVVWAIFLCGHSIWSSGSPAIWKRTLYFGVAYVVILVYVFLLAFIGSCGNFFYHHIFAHDVVYTHYYLRPDLPHNSHTMTFRTFDEVLFFDMEGNNIRTKAEQVAHDATDTKAAISWRYENLTVSASGKYSYDFDNVHSELSVVANGTTSKQIDKIRAVDFVWWDDTGDRLYFLIETFWNEDLLCMRDYDEMWGNRK